MRVIEGGLNSIYRTFRGALCSSCVFIFSLAVKIHLVFQRIYGREAERNFYESQLIILDTLEKVLNSVKDLFKLNLLRDIHVCMHLCLQQPKDTSRLDEAMYVKLLLPEICKVFKLIILIQAEILQNNQNVIASYFGLRKIVILTLE